MSVVRKPAELRCLTINTSQEEFTLMLFGCSPGEVNAASLSVSASASAAASAGGDQACVEESTRLNFSLLSTFYTIVRKLNIVAIDGSDSVALSSCLRGVEYCVLFLSAFSAAGKLQRPSNQLTLNFTLLSQERRNRVRYERVNIVFFCCLSYIVDALLFTKGFSINHEANDDILVLAYTTRTATGNYHARLFRNDANDDECSNALFVVGVTSNNATANLTQLFHQIC